MLQEGTGPQPRGLGQCRLRGACGVHDNGLCKGHTTAHHLQKQPWRVWWRRVRPAGRFGTYGPYRTDFGSAQVAAACNFMYVRTVVLILIQVTSAGLVAHLQDGTPLRARRALRGPGGLQPNGYGY